MKIINLLTVFTLLMVVGCEEELVIPENHQPVIFSLTAFPEIVATQDSVIIICNAMDPDGDTLVYDWISDSRLKIKGAKYPDFILYHTYENSRIVYPTTVVNLPVDTVWIQCFARDVKGKSDAEFVRFIVQQNKDRRELIFN